MIILRFDLLHNQNRSVLCRIIPIWRPAVSQGYFLPDNTAGTLMASVDFQPAQPGFEVCKPGFLLLHTPFQLGKPFFIRFG